MPFVRKTGVTSRWLTESASGPDFVDACLLPLATTPARRASDDGAVCEAGLLPFASADAAVLEALGLAVAALLFLARLALVSLSVLLLLLLLLQGPPLLLSMTSCSSGCRRHPDTGLGTMQ